MIQIKYAAADAACLIALLDSFVAASPPASHPIRTFYGGQAKAAARGSASQASIRRSPGAAPGGGEAGSDASPAPARDAVALEQDPQSQAVDGSGLRASLEGLSMGDSGPTAEAACSAAHPEAATASTEAVQPPRDAASNGQAECVAVEGGGGANSIGEVVRWWAERLEMSGRGTLVRFE